MTVALIVAGFIALIIYIVVSTEKNSVKGTCPNCNSKVSLYKGIGTCNNCDWPLRSVDGQIKQADQGFVSDAPLFWIKLSKLKPPSQWKATWQDRCCICGQVAARSDNIKIKWIRSSVGGIVGPAVNMTDDVKYGVGYCNAHTNGIAFAFAAGFGNTKSNAQSSLGIRSSDYYREFLKENRSR